MTIIFNNNGTETEITGMGNFAGQAVTEVWFKDGSAAAVKVWPDAPPNNDDLYQGFDVPDIEDIADASQYQNSQAQFIIASEDVAFFQQVSGYWYSSGSEAGFSGKWNIGESTEIDPSRWEVMFVDTIPPARADLVLQTETHNQFGDIGYAWSGPLLTWNWTNLGSGSDECEIECTIREKANINNFIKSTFKLIVSSV